MGGPGSSTPKRSISLSTQGAGHRQAGPRPAEGPADSRRGVGSARRRRGIRKEGRGGEEPGRSQRGILDEGESPGAAGSLAPPANPLLDRSGRPGGTGSRQSRFERSHRDEQNVQSNWSRKSDSCSGVRGRCAGAAPCVLPWLSYHRPGRRRHGRRGVAAGGAHAGGDAPGDGGALAGIGRRRSRSRRGPGGDDAGEGGLLAVLSRSPATGRRGTMRSWRSSDVRGCRRPAKNFFNGRGRPDRASLGRRRRSAASRSPAVPRPRRLEGEGWTCRRPSWRASGLI